MRRRAQVGLNKGEAHHALKRAINFHQSGELRDRTEEGQHYRVAGLNLLAAIIIYWNTLKLGEAVFIRRNAGLDVPADFLAHVSPLGMGTHQPHRRIPVAKCRPTLRAKTLPEATIPTAQDCQERMRRSRSSVRFRCHSENREDSLYGARAAARLGLSPSRGKGRTANPRALP